jgi:hypothetical protein
VAPFGPVREGCAELSAFGAPRPSAEERQMTEPQEHLAVVLAIVAAAVIVVLMLVLT